VIAISKRAAGERKKKKLPEGKGGEKIDEISKKGMKGKPHNKSP